MAAVTVIIFGPRALTAPWMMDPSVPQRPQPALAPSPRRTRVQEQQQNTPVSASSPMSANHATHAAIDTCSQPVHQPHGTHHREGHGEHYDTGP